MPIYEAEEKCPECDRNMIIMRDKFASCPMGHGKLLFAFTRNEEKKEIKDDTL